MTNNQREIISDFLKSILDNGAVGDFQNCYNDSKSLVRQLKETDSKLKEMCDQVEEDFENPF